MTRGDSRRDTPTMLLRIVSMLFPLFAVFFLIAASGGVGWVVARLAGIEARTLVPPMMFNNCGNLGLPPAVLNFMFAERYHQEPDKVASMVLIGNLAALVFLPAALALTLK